MNSYVISLSLVIRLYKCIIEFRMHYAWMHDRVYERVNNGLIKSVTRSLLQNVPPTLYGRNINKKAIAWYASPSNWEWRNKTSKPNRVHNCISISMHHMTETHVTSTKWEHKAGMHCCESPLSPSKEPWLHFLSSWPVDNWKINAWEWRGSRLVKEGRGGEGWGKAEGQTVRPTRVGSHQTVPH